MKFYYLLKKGGALQGAPSASEETLFQEVILDQSVKNAHYISEQNVSLQRSQHLFSHVPHFVGPSVFCGPCLPISILTFFQPTYQAPVLKKFKQWQLVQTLQGKKETSWKFILGVMSILNPVLGTIFVVYFFLNRGNFVKGTFSQTAK